MLEIIRNKAKLKIKKEEEEIWLPSQEEMENSQIYIKKKKNAQSEFAQISREVDR